MNSIQKNIEDSLISLCPNLTDSALQTLVRMYCAGTLDGTEQKNREIGLERISEIQGSELHRIFRDNSVKKSLEIGFAYGYSTIWLIDAISKFEGGLHTAIDPFEKSHWGGVGLWQVMKTDGFDNRFNWKNEYSINALTDFFKQGVKFDGIFIDGNHRFDDVLVDFYLADKVLKVGGVIAFDDMWMDSIRSVVSFVIENRSDYIYLEQKAKNMAVFIKQSNDVRDWRHFIPFSTSHQPLI